MASGAADRAESGRNYEGHGRGAFGKIISADIWPYKYAGTLYVFITGRYSEGRVKTINFNTNNKLNS